MKTLCERCMTVCRFQGQKNFSMETCRYFHQKAQTVGDKLRAMSDEELVDIFLRADFCKCCEHEKDGVCNYICDYPNIPLYDGCKQAALAWMKQPTKEDTAATALSTFQAENEKLRAELENYRKGHCAEGGCAAEKDRDAVLAELERVKRERDAAVEDLHKLCPAWKWDGQKEG